MRIPETNPASKILGICRRLQCLGSGDPFRWGPSRNPHDFFFRENVGSPVVNNFCFLMHSLCDEDVWVTFSLFDALMHINQVFFQMLCVEDLPTFGDFCFLSSAFEELHEAPLPPVFSTVADLYGSGF